MNKSQKAVLLSQVAEMYYHQDKSQQEIASLLGISRFKVSRLLKQARSEGIVQIRIVPPQFTFSETEKKLRWLFKLKEAIVVLSPSSAPSTIRKTIGHAAAIYLEKTLKDNDVIGVTSGHSLYETTHYLKSERKLKIVVVQLSGGYTPDFQHHYAYEIARNIARAFSGTCYLLFTPVILQNLKQKKAIETCEFVKKITDLWKEVNYAIIGVGSFEYWAHYPECLRKKDFLSLKKKKAVGEIAGRFFDIQGKEIITPLSARTLSISLSNLKKVEKVVLIAGGEEKVLPILGALQGGYANVLITDENTAQELIALKTQNLS